MDTAAASALFDFLNKAGLFGGALFIVWLFYTERVVPASRLEEQKAATRAALEATKELSNAVKELTATVGEVRVAIATLTAFSARPTKSSPRARGGNE